MNFSHTPHKIFNYVIDCKFVGKAKSLFMSSFMGVNGLMNQPLLSLSKYYRNNDMKEQLDFFPSLKLSPQPPKRSFLTRA